jgi:glycoside/pentoside/hexuronide:cation symporter, GPH family
MSILPVRKTEKFFYGMGNLGYGVVAQTYNSFIMFFGTAVIGLSGTLMGIAVAASVLWDAITDPIIGYLSDKQKSPFFGKRHGFMLFGFAGIALFNIFIWSVPSFLDPTGKFVWLLVSMLAFETFNTMFATPYTALGTEMSDDYNERTNIQAYKTIFFLISFIAPAILIYIFLPPDLSNATQQGYMNISMVTSFMAIIFGLFCILGTFSSIPRLKKKYEKAKIEKKEKTPTQIFKMFFYSLKRKNYNSLVMGYAVSLISSAFISGIGLHLFNYSFHFSKTQIAILMGGFVLATIISQPFWVKFSRKLEKKPAILAGLLTSIFGLLIISLTFILKTNMSANILFILSAIAIFISGFGTGALYSIPISMLADLMTIEYAKTSRESAGIYSGFMTLAYKVANAIALLILGLLLDVIKFDSTLIEQPIGVQNGLAIVAMLGVFISLIGAFAIYSQYTVKRQQVEKANRKIFKINKAKDKN